MCVLYMPAITLILRNYLLYTVHAGLRAIINQLNIICFNTFHSIMATSKINSVLHKPKFQQKYHERKQE